MILPHGSEWKRVDYSEEGWTGPPEEAVGWWKSSIPQQENTRPKLAPNEVLLQFFTQLYEKGSRPEMLYVLSLLLLRRRILRAEEEEQQPGKQALYCPRNEETYHVAPVDLSVEQIQGIQDELQNLLFSGGETADASQEGKAAGDETTEG